MDVERMQEQQAQLTPVSVAEMYAALSAAWRARFGTEASRSSLLVLLAQWAEESGRGRFMHNYNIGNIKAVPGNDAHDWCFFRCDEIVGGKTVWFDPPDPACCFRSYGTLAEGADDYLELLHRRFASAWPAVVAGDPAQFSHHLKMSHYYTADEGLYTRALTSLFNEFAREVPEPVFADPRPFQLMQDIDAGKEGLS